MENLVISEKIAFFHNFPAQSGITTNNFGSTHFINNPDHEFFCKKLLDITNKNNCYCKIRPDHSDKVVLIKYESRSVEYLCDALVFVKKRFNNAWMKPTLISNTADCPTIVVTHSQSGTRSIIHSGWKGTYKNITGKTIKIIRKEGGINPNSLYAYVWGGICGDCYEVGPDFKKYFPEKIINGRLDLKKIIIEQLLESGMRKERIITSDYCSYHSKDKNGQYFFRSHRREKNAGLRNSVFIAS